MKENESQLNRSHAVPAVHTPREFNMRIARWLIAGDIISDVLGMLGLTVLCIVLSIGTIFAERFIGDSSPHSTEVVNVFDLP